jgi:phosphate transport system permease protein
MTAPRDDLPGRSSGSPAQAVTVRLAKSSEAAAIPRQSAEADADIQTRSASGRVARVARPVAGKGRVEADPAARGAAPDVADAGPVETRVRLRKTSADGSATFIAAAAASLGLVWVLYERVLPFSGVLGFWVSWYVLFLCLYFVMARLQWDRLEARNRLAGVALGTGGVLAVVIVVMQVAYTLAKGSGAVVHANFWTRSLGFAGPSSPMTIGGVLHAIVGSLEEIGLATLFSVPLGITAALFLAEIGGGLARVVRTIVEAMTALPDLVAGLFVYVTLILSLGISKNGFCAAVAIAMTMMPIVARASEVVLRIVPGALREASFALGSTQWRTVWNVVLPTARSGLTTAVVLAMARGIGETAPVLLVAGYTKELNTNPFHGPMTSLPLFIYNAVHVLGTPDYVERGFGAGFVLVVVVLALFTIARRIGGSATGEITKRQRRRLAREAAQ